MYDRLSEVTCKCRLYIRVDNWDACKVEGNTDPFVSPHSVTVPIVIF